MLLAIGLKRIEMAALSRDSIIPQCLAEVVAEELHEHLNYATSFWPLNFTY